MKFKEDETEDKLRGGYYTPLDVARFLSQWVLASSPKNILEPSCGDGAFIRALSQFEIEGVAVVAVERQPAEAEKARNAASALASRSCDIFVDDFLRWSQCEMDLGSSFDSIVGNPPYIRYQYLDIDDQRFSKEIFERFSLSFTKHTNAWVPFVIACVHLLSPGGRLGMVIPSELIYVLHASSLRQFLIENSMRILVLDPTELLFDTALQGTVLLMVEKKTTKEQDSLGVAILPAPDNSFLREDPEEIFAAASYVPCKVSGEKWMRLLLSSDELAVLNKAESLEGVRRFNEVAKVDVGIVTGANKFFLIDDSVVEKYGLDDFVRPMFGRSEHCPGVIYNDSVHQANRARGLPTNFLFFEKTVRDKDLSPSVIEYIKYGESQGLNTRYKCRIRNPWYAVPSVYATDVGLLKRSHSFPRLILNELGAYTTDTAYRVSTLPKGPDSKKLVYCFVNSLTALSSELEGRHYGGGVLELVPSEIERLLIPLPDVKVQLAKLDREVRSELDSVDILKSQDEKILLSVGLAAGEVSLLQGALLRVRARRQRLAPSRETEVDE